MYAGGSFLTGSCVSSHSTCAFLWYDPDQDQWSKMSRIMVHQRGTIKSTLDKHSSAPLMHHDPTDLGSVILTQIIPKDAP